MEAPLPLQAAPPAIQIARRASATPTPDELAKLREGLSRPLPEIPARYFYDDAGSRLFEQITELDVYYQTRTEIAILEQRAPEILARTRPERLVELGSGAGRKIRLLLDAWAPLASRGRCTMLDINESFLRQSILTLSQDYPQRSFDGVVGDFGRDLGLLGPPGGRLIVFFAGTIGNLNPTERLAFLQRLAAGMDHRDHLLVGVDLVKDAARLEAAYDDPQGVTAAFDLNMLSALNQRFDADFDPSAFRHRAFYDPDQAWIEMRLVATRASTVHVPPIELTLKLRPGDEIRTELSCKFTRASLDASAAGAGLAVTGWFTDPDALFALALIEKGAA